MIPRTSSERNCRANVEIFDFTLDQTDIARIAALPKDRRILDPDWAPAWD